MVTKPAAPIKCLGKAVLASWSGYDVGVTTGATYEIYSSIDHVLPYFIDDRLSIRLIGDGTWDFSRDLYGDDDDFILVNKTLEGFNKKEQIEMSKTPPAMLKPQPDPTSAPESVSVVPEVMKDLTDRLAMGVKTYGKPLQSFNGRDALQDLYEEILDAACYIKQLMMERK